MKSMNRGSLSLLAGLVFGLLFPLPASAQESGSTGELRVALGQEMKVYGVIVKRAPDTFTMRDSFGQDVVVTLRDHTEVREKKSNPFRGAKNYATTQLLRGLLVEVKGRGGPDGTLVAHEIKFRDDDLKTATSLTSMVVPVERRLESTEHRLAENEENAKRLSGQVEELNAISNAARGGAKAAQETADAALAGVSRTNERIDATVRSTNERFSALDDFDVREETAVLFKAGSSTLSGEAKAELDRMAERARLDRGYVIQVTGYASSDGSAEYNRRLSQRRADEVVRYLVEEHQIPLRRLVTPFGYGEKMPSADNDTREGRAQNRRVEVKILVSKGITGSVQGQSTGN